MIIAYFKQNINFYFIKKDSKSLQWRHLLLIVRYVVTSKC